jgi:hypothetical protein
MATHTASSKLPPAEDIGSILHRFEHWAGGHQPAEIRELTFEEALARARRRRADTDELAEPASKTKAAPASKPAPKDASGTVTKPQPAAVGTAKAADPKPSRNAAKSTSRVKAQKPRAKATAAPPREAKPATAGRTFQQALEDEITRPRTAHLAGELLRADTVELTARPANAASSVSLSVKMSVADRNVIRTRAQSLGLTPGAYLRQCALEVESLRAEMQQLLLARAQAAPRSLPPAQKPNWLARLRGLFFAHTSDRQATVYRA